jgi:hypothetical protein
VEYFRISGHAKEQIRIRGLSIQIIEMVWDDPDSVLPESSGVICLQKIVLENNKPYLYRVFINLENEPPIIITAYKTSKFWKYENQIR